MVLEGKNEEAEKRRRGLFGGAIGSPVGKERKKTDNAREEWVGGRDELRMNEDMN